jgi:uncharacterized protein YjbI with pentapeptide repeats
MLRYRLSQWDIRASRFLADLWGRCWAYIERIHDVVADVTTRGIYLLFRRVPLIGFALAALVLYLTWRFVWEWANSYVGPSSTAERNDLLTTVAQIAGGFAVAIGVFFTFRSIQVNREGQVTERFTRAIDHIGEDALEVRLGGIYALERISRDSARDHGPVLEVLTAYIRNRAPVDDLRMAEWQAWDPDDAAHAVLPLPSVREQDRVADDVQAALTVIGRRRRGKDRQEQFPFDLANCDLRFATFVQANLAQAGFVASDLEGAYFAGSDLSECPMMFANLRGATFLLSSLRGANLDYSVVIEATLNGTTLQGASLLGTKFQGSSLDDAVFWGNVLLGTRFEYSSLDRALLVGARFHTPNFSYASLLNANLGMTECEGGSFEGANLSGATLFGASMSDVVLPRAIFQGANLESAQFTNCDLSEANLIDADLTRTEFFQTSLHGADLTGAILDGAVFTDSDLGEAVGLTNWQLVNTVIAGVTRLPDYLLQPPDEVPE